MARILVVEDDSPFAFVLRELLESYGHEVETCDCVKDAKSALLVDDFDVLITDMYFREGGSISQEGGLSLLAWIKSQKWTDGRDFDDLNIIAMSGGYCPKYNPFALASAVGMGAGRVFPKPVKVEELLDAVQNPDPRNDQVAFPSGLVARSAPREHADLN